ncbi:MAG: VOC family protein [Actinomycetota bacterium]
MDCADAETTAEFYSQLLGWEITSRDEPPVPGGASPWLSVRDPNGGVGLLFQAEAWYEPPVWPEESGRPTKMLHLEIAVDDVDAAVERAVALGATVAPHQPHDRDPQELRVMLDPAGHPFCLWK